MKWKFCVLRQAQLGLISLLPLVIAMACKRNKPRYEPDFLGYQEYEKKSTMNPIDIQEPSAGIPNGSKPCGSRWDKLPEYYKDSKDIADLLKEIDCYDFFRLPYSKNEKEAGNNIFCLEVDPNEAQNLGNDFSALIESKLTLAGKDDRDLSNTLPNTLCIIFKSNQHKGCDRLPLVSTEAITIRSNPVLANSEKDSFSLIGFVVDGLKNNDSKDDLVAFVQLDQKWYLYNDSTKNAVLTEVAIDLASKSATTFFYRKIT